MSEQRHIALLISPPCPLYHNSCGATAANTINLEDYLREQMWQSTYQWPNTNICYTNAVHANINRHTLDQTLSAFGKITIQIIFSVI